jgi:hypothetical protein
VEDLPHVAAQVAASGRVQLRVALRKGLVCAASKSIRTSHTCRDELNWNIKLVLR